MFETVQAKMASSERKQKPLTLIGFAFTVILSAVVGTIPTAILASAENGYVAGYFLLPVLFLVLVVCVGLLICAIIFIVKEKFAVGLYFLLSIFLIPASWVASASVAKHFEIGAYRVEPMVPMIPPVANKIIFKRGVTDREVQDFWRDVLSMTRRDGRGKDPLPGIQSIGTSLPEDGHEVLLFSFFASATDEEKAAARQRILASPRVKELLEDADTSSYGEPPQLADESNANSNPKKGFKVTIPK